MGADVAMGVIPHLAILKAVTHRNGLHVHSVPANKGDMGFMRRVPVAEEQFIQAAARFSVKQITRGGCHFLIYKNETPEHKNF